MTEQSTQTERLRKSLSDKGFYSHDINIILQACKEAGLRFVETVNPPSLQDPGADTYPIVREIEI